MKSYGEIDTSEQVALFPSRFTSKEKAYATHWRWSPEMSELCEEKYLFSG
jgi:hypothetical protein